MSITHLTDSEFEDRISKAEKPVLVDFWADWCAPCKQLAPHLDTLAETHGDRIDIVKIDIEANPETPTRFGVRSIPTLILFRDGQASATKIGSVESVRDLESWVGENI